MPYIDKAARNDIATGTAPRTAGELNYVLTNTILDYMKQGSLSYRVINEVIGVLECCKLEMYRRLAQPYEDAKIRENGDVYP